MLPKFRCASPEKLQAERILNTFLPLPSVMAGLWVKRVAWPEAHTPPTDGPTVWRFAPVRSRNHAKRPRCPTGKSQKNILKLIVDQGERWWLCLFCERKAQRLSGDSCCCSTNRLAPLNLALLDMMADTCDSQATSLAGYPPMGIISSIAQLNRTDEVGKNSKLSMVYQHEYGWMP